MALSGHSAIAVEGPLSGAKRTLASRCSPASIYEYTHQSILPPKNRRPGAPIKIANGKREEYKPQ